MAKLNEEQRRALPKAEALKLLPAGTQVALTLRPDGSWTGRLTVGGTQVETVGVVGAGPQAVVGALAQLWASELAAGSRASPDRPR